jgi:putative membrane protein
MNTILKTFLHGIVFGVANIIPGVSGATLAVALGFFEDLIDSINNFTKDYKKHTLFLLPLAIGAAISIIIFSSLITFLLTNYSFPTTLFFVGLIVGSIPLIYSKTKKDFLGSFSLKDSIIVLLSFLFVILLSLNKPVDATSVQDMIQLIDARYMIFIFFSGIISSSAMIIPGLSGSFILLLLGIYPLVSYSISSISMLISDITNVYLIMDISKVLVPLGLGIIVGVILVSRLISILLEKYNRLTYLIILGLIFGSIFTIFSNPISYQSGVGFTTIIISIFTFTIGFLICLKFGNE